jgi:hypothetical protein
MTLHSEFKAMEERLAKLKRQHETGEISEEELYQQLQELHLSVGQEEWRLGVAGEWVKRAEGGAWEPATPPAVKSEDVLQAEDEAAAEEESVGDTAPPSEAQGGAPPPPEGPSSGPDQPKPSLPPRPQWARGPVIGVIVSVLLLGLLVGGLAWFTKPPVTPTAVAGITYTPTGTTTTVPAGTPTPSRSPAPSSTFTNTPTATPIPLPTDTLTPSPTATFPTLPTLTVMPPTPTAVQQIHPPQPTSMPAGLLAYPIFNSETRNYDIYVQRLETGQVIRTIKNASQPDVRPDGKQIVYRSWQSDRRGLVVENLDGSGSPWLASILFEAARPIWNNTGEDLVFAANNLSPHQWGLYFSGDRPGRGGGRTPAWFTDGHIVYQGDIEGQYGLVVANPGDGQRSLLTHSTQDSAPAPSVDGSYIVFMSDRDGTWDLYLLDVGTQQVTRLTSDSAFDTSPIWSPDGKRIAFVSNRDGHWAIWTMQPDGADLQQLLRLPGSFDGKVAEAPDNQQTGWQTEHISWVE